jgi:hypothetical protein
MGTKADLDRSAESGELKGARIDGSARLAIQRISPTVPSALAKTRASGIHQYQ